MESCTRSVAMEAADYLRMRTRYCPKVGLILGSGLNSLAARVLEPDIVPYSEIPHFPRTSVPGHSGRLLLGQLSGVVVCLMQGRAHYYEGYSTAEVSLPVRVMQILGVRILVVTNAAGGIRHGLHTGDLMAITDHINLLGLAGHHPLRGPNDDSLGHRFPSMTRAYDPDLLALVRAEAQDHGISLHEGIYAMVAGPSYETPAEVRFLRAIGADAVGMSTVPEVIVARHGGMRVLGISLISNVAIDSPESAQEASHKEVLEAGQRAAPVLGTLVEGVLRRLS